MYHFLIYKLDFLLNWCNSNQVIDDDIMKNVMYHLTNFRLVLFDIKFEKRYKLLYQNELRALKYSAKITQLYNELLDYLYDNTERK